MNMQLSSQERILEHELSSAAIELDTLFQTQM